MTIGIEVSNTPTPTRNTADSQGRLYQRLYAPELTRLSRRIQSCFQGMETSEGFKSAASRAYGVHTGSLCLLRKFGILNFLLKIKLHQISVFLVSFFSLSSCVSRSSFLALSPFHVSLIFLSIYLPICLFVYMPI